MKGQSYSADWWTAMEAVVDDVHVADRIVQLPSIFVESCRRIQEDRREEGGDYCGIATTNATQNLDCKKEEEAYA